MRKVICSIGKMMWSTREKKVPKKIKKILIFKIGALGDVLMTTPMVRAIRRAHPEAEITYLVGKFCKKNLEYNPNIDQLKTFDHNIFFKKNIRKLVQLIKKIKKEKYDVVVIADFHWLINLSLFFTGIQHRVGFDRYGEGFPNTTNVPYKKVKHAIDYYLELAYKLGAKKVRKKDKQMEVFLKRKNREKAQNFLKKNNIKNDFICVAPGGAKNPGQDMSERRWPVEKFVELTKRLTKKGMVIVLIGGPKDKDLLKEGFPKEAVNAIGKLDLKTSIALMEKAKLAIVSDTGPMHFAAAVQTPTISLFGVTDPRRKAPLKTGKIKHQYIWKKPKVKGWNDDGVFSNFKEADTIKEITIDEVMKKIIEQ